MLKKYKTSVPMKILENNCHYIWKTLSTDENVYNRIYETNQHYLIDHYNNNCNLASYP